MRAVLRQLDQTDAPRALRDQELAWVSGIIVPFSGPDKLDAYGNYWDAETDFMLGRLRSLPLMNYHARDGHAAEAGTVDADYLEVTPAGLHATGVLYDNSEGREFLRAVEGGQAFFSTGAAPHLILDEPDGRIARWPLVEASQTPRPAAFRGETRIISATGLRDIVGLDTVQQGGFFDMPQDVNMEREGVDTGAELARLMEEMRGLRGAVQSVLDGQQEGSGEPQYTRDGDGVPPATFNPGETPLIEVRGQYDDVPLGAMLFYHSLAAHSGLPYAMRHIDNAFYRAVVDKAGEAVAREDELVNKMLAQGRGVQPWTRSVDREAYNAWHEVVPYLRSDEAMHSDLTGYGPDLIPTLLSSQVWHDVSLATRVGQQFSWFDMPSNPYNWPTMGSGPTIRRIPEFADQASATISNSNIPTSTVATSKKTFTADTVGALTLFSQRLFEDASINIVTELYTAFQLATAKAIDEILLSGDESTGVANISHLGADPSSTVYDRLMVLDGLRHMAFASSDATAIATWAATSPTTLRALMGTRGVLGVDPSNLMLIIDPAVYYKTLALSDLKSLSDIGPKATLLTGQVGELSGIPLIVSDQLEATNADGKIEDSHDGTKGSALLVHRGVHKIGRMRAATMQHVAIPGTTGQAVWTSLRFDLQQFQAGGVAYAYNITV